MKSSSSDSICAGFSKNRIASGLGLILFLGACGPRPPAIRLDGVLPSPENFFGDIISLDSSKLPALDFIVRTRSERGQDPFSKGLANQPYRYVRVYRDNDRGREGVVQKIVDLVRRFKAGDGEIKALEFWGLSSLDPGSPLMIGVDRILELTGLSYYDRDPGRYPSAGGLSLDGVSGWILGCVTPPARKK